MVKAPPKENKPYQHFISVGKIVEVCGGAPQAVGHRIVQAATTAVEAAPPATATATTPLQVQQLPLLPLLLLPAATTTTTTTATTTTTTGTSTSTSTNTNTNYCYYCYCYCYHDCFFWSYFTVVFIFILPAKRRRRSSNDFMESTLAASCRALECHCLARCGFLHQFDSIDAIARRRVAQARRTTREPLVFAMPSLPDLESYHIDPTPWNPEARRGSARGAPAAVSGLGV